MQTLRRVVFGVPSFAWLTHIFVIVPALSVQSGCVQFGLAVDFFCLSTLAMLVCLGPSVFLVCRSRTPSDVLAILLNLSWLYYLKVLAWGPTIGLL